MKGREEPLSVVEGTTAAMTPGTGTEPEGKKRGRGERDTDWWIRWDRSTTAEEAQTGGSLPACVGRERFKDFDEPPISAEFTMGTCVYVMAAWRFKSAHPTLNDPCKVQDTKQ